MKFKTAGFITVGNEILSGEIKDANMYYFATRARDHGFRVVEYTAVEDNIKEISSTLKRMAKKVDLLIVSGGLGPTDDDLTRESAARAAGVKLIVNKRVLRRLREYFEGRGFGFPESNVKQATFPEGAKIIDNPAGTAPGFLLRIKGTDVFFLPGVPDEFKRMVDEKVLPILSKKTRTEVFSKIYRIFGLPESRVGEILKNFTMNDVEIAYLPEFPEVNLKITVIARKGERRERVFDEVDRKLKELLGDFIFGYDNDTLESIVGRLLFESKKTLSIAESITGGLIGHRLTQIPGSSAYFDRSIVCYSNEAKIQMLGVNRDTLQRFGAVSEETALEMARGVRIVSGTDIGLSVTGIAGPGGGSEEKPVGTVYAGLSTKEEEHVRHYLFGGLPRERVKILTAEVALDLLRRYLAGKLSK